MDYKERCKYLENRIKHLNLIGIALSTEENLLHKILLTNNIIYCYEICIILKITTKSQILFRLSRCNKF